MADATVTVAAKMTYTGNPITPAVTVVYDGSPLTVNVDYVLNYVDNVNVGHRRLHRFRDADIPYRVRLFRLVELRPYGHRIQRCRASGLAVRYVRFDNKRTVHEERAGAS
jgi:hypothetical protein